ncbi:phasin family protein [Adlercreutzia murintestinalis]|uniref:phasin family protein n=1 Tax=Adlercreutzia murintestinalis TaxID=2941325 RepID=UPI00204110A1|nr:hypothetical protein [Adlercreutzia murintestinalis]
MATMNDPFREIFLAGVGALALGAEKSKEIVDQLVSKGQITVDQGKEIATDLQHQAHENTAQVRDEVIRAYLGSLSKDERDAFAARIADMAAQVDGDEALRDQEATEVQESAKASS